MRSWSRSLRGQVQQVLGSLGDHPVQIAQQLEMAGVRGTPSHPEDCAIAVYLSAVIGADPDVHRVKVTYEHVVISSARWYRPRVTVRLSRPLQSFIASFDRGRYPQLTRAHSGPSVRDQQVTHQGSS